MLLENEERSKCAMKHLF